MGTHLYSYLIPTVAKVGTVYNTNTAASVTTALVTSVAGGTGSVAFTGVNNGGYQQMTVVPNGIPLSNGDIGASWMFGATVPISEANPSEMKLDLSAQLQNGTNGFFDQSATFAGSLVVDYIVFPTSNSYSSQGTSGQLIELGRSTNQDAVNVYITDQTGSLTVTCNQYIGGGYHTTNYALGSLKLTQNVTGVLRAIYTFSSPSAISAVQLMYSSSFGTTWDWTYVVPANAATYPIGAFGSTLSYLCVGAWPGNGNGWFLGKFLGYALGRVDSSADFTTAPTYGYSAPKKSGFSYYVDITTNTPTGGLGTQASPMSLADLTTYQNMLALPTLVWRYNGTLINPADWPPNSDVLASAYNAGTLYFDQTIGDSVYILSRNGTPQYMSQSFSFNAPLYVGPDVPGVMVNSHITNPVTTSQISADGSYAGVFQFSCNGTYPFVWINDLRPPVCPPLTGGSYNASNYTITFPGAPFAGLTIAGGYFTFPDLTSPATIRPANFSAPTLIQNVVSNTNNTLTLSGPLLCTDGVTPAPNINGMVVSNPMIALNTTQIASTQTVSSYNNSTKVLTVSGTPWASTGQGQPTFQYAYLTSASQPTYNGLYSVSATGSNTITLIGGPSVAVSDFVLNHQTGCRYWVSQNPGSFAWDPGSTTMYVQSPTQPSLTGQSLGTNNLYEWSYTSSAGANGWNFGGTAAQGVFYNIGCVGTMTAYPNYGFTSTAMLGNYCFGSSCGLGITAMVQCYADFAEKHCWGAAPNVYGHWRNFGLYLWGGRGHPQGTPYVSYGANFSLGYSFMDAYKYCSTPYPVFGTGGNYVDFASGGVIWTSHCQYNVGGGSSATNVFLLPNDNTTSSTFTITKSSTNLLALVYNSPTASLAFGHLQATSLPAANDTFTLFDGYYYNEFQFYTSTPNVNNYVQIQIGATHAAMSANIAAAIQGVTGGWTGTIGASTYVSGIPQKFSLWSGDFPIKVFLDNSYWGFYGAQGPSWQGNSFGVTMRNSILPNNTNYSYNLGCRFYAVPLATSGSVASGVLNDECVFSPIGVSNSSFAWLRIGGTITNRKCTKDYSGITSGSFVAWLNTTPCKITEIDCLTILPSGVGEYGSVGSTSSSNFTITATGSIYICPQGSSQPIMDGYAGASGTKTAANLSSIVSGPTKGSLYYTSLSAAGYGSSPVITISKISPVLGAGTVNLSNTQDVTGTIFANRNSVGAWENTLLLASRSATFDIAQQQLTKAR